MTTALLSHVKAQCTHCERAAKAKGMCWKHYIRVRRHNDPNYGRQKEGPCYCCGRPHKAHGLCNACYQAWKKAGAPTNNGKEIWIEWRMKVMRPFRKKMGMTY